MHDDICGVDLRKELRRGQDISHKPIDLCIFGVAILKALPTCEGEYLLIASTVAACWTNLDAK